MDLIASSRSLDKLDAELTRVKAQHSEEIATLNHELSQTRRALNEARALPDRQATDFSHQLDSTKADLLKIIEEKDAVIAEFEITLHAYLEQAGVKDASLVALKDRTERLESALNDERRESARHITRIQVITSNNNHAMLMLI